MGNTFHSCKTCNNTSNTTINQPNQISSYYSSRLAQIPQLLHNIPYYQNVNYVRLANDLRNRGEKFTDLLTRSQQLINDDKIQWKRITEVYPHQKFSKDKRNYQFTLEVKNKLPTYNLATDLLKLKNYPELIQKIFANTQVSLQGFYVLYFCIGGNIQKKVQIVIDDYIPVNSQGRYIFQQPKKGEGIWMILIQKAWAKLLKSYHQLQIIKPTYFFSEMTGVPRPQLYSKGDFLMSIKYDFNTNQSKYIKINRDSSVLMLVCIWLPNISENFFTDMQPIDFIAETIIQNNKQSAKQYLELPLTTQKINNKIVLVNNQNKGMFMLPVGQSIIHIFNKSKSKKNCNIVIHAKTPVNTHTRNEKQYQTAKVLMIQNQYKKIHFKIGTQFQNPQIQLKFCWMKHRGIFCLKNKSKQTKQIELIIKKIYTNQVFFEDYQKNSKKVTLKPKQHGFFVVIRSQNKQYGPFYEINVNRTV